MGLHDVNYKIISYKFYGLRSQLTTTSNQTNWELDLNSEINWMMQLALISVNDNDSICCSSF